MTLELREVGPTPHPSVFLISASPAQARSARCLVPQSGEMRNARTLVSSVRFVRGNEYAGSVCLWQTKVALPGVLVYIWNQRLAQVVALAGSVSPFEKNSF